MLHFLLLVWIWFKAFFQAKKVVPVAPDVLSEAEFANRLKTVHNIDLSNAYSDMMKFPKVAISSLDLPKEVPQPDVKVFKKV